MTTMTAPSLRGALTRTTLLLGLSTAFAAPLQASEDLPRGYYLLPEEGDLVGEVYSVEADKEDTLIDIGHEHGIGYRAMVRANPDVSVWYPGEGTEVTIPGQFILPDAPRNGIVINVAEMRLYYYPPAEEGEPRIVQTYPLGVGRQDWETPLGNTTITQKVENPAWYPPESIRREHAEAGDPLPGVVPAGPDNPLGTRKMRLGIPGYLIHGTNKPEGVGMRVSHGCVRMLPQDVEHLFDQIAVGTQVRLINESFKLGWSDGTLYVQAYPYLDDKQGTSIQRVTEALGQVDASIEGLEYPVDYSRLREVVEIPGGMPVALESAPEPAEPTPAPETLYDRLELIAARPSLYDQLPPQG
ncbi:L,D-transpeptidase family protein [Halomonas stenophila]|uniref:L,D-transpeptidase ErfK/SrfK n=1 Tax=Halomonas stenophila TaxID=795312 RepID=A0A7W5ER52_9GAMM|nr:L,D-transpeptidase family protein [Halomonas stenophila]MBB3229522.1 L,D-transpeptidase ErfK/SrfK [Halomonas stenophila]